MSSQIEDPACAAAHGAEAAPVQDRAVIAVFATPVAEFLLRYAADAGYRPVLVEPDAGRVRAAKEADRLPPGTVLCDTGVTQAMGGLPAGSADVVVTDHHRPELGVALRDALAGDTRWVGIMGNPRHEGPHVAALTELGVPPAEIARVHRPIGLSIGSRTPAEIAIATIAGLIADRNGKPGGFAF